jgi:hypothetical protein
MFPFNFSLQTLKTAVILADRPGIGADACLATDPLPSVTWIRFNVLGIGIVRCAVEHRAVRALSNRCSPTWGDLQAVWQTIVELADRKIRAADFDPGRQSRDRPPVVRIASADA